jgi:hypothetical protein
MFPHPRPLPRDGVDCVGHSGSRGRGGTRGQRRSRSQITVETTTRAPRAPTGTHSAPIRHSPGDWLIFPPPTPIPLEKIPTHLRPRPRENVPVPLRTRNRHPQAPNPPTSNESTTNGAFPLRGKVPKGRMRGRVANGEDARIPSREQQLDVPPPPAPPPRRGRLCWAQRVARERGDAQPTANAFASHRRNDHPSTPRPHTNPFVPNRHSSGDWHIFPPPPPIPPAKISTHLRPRPRENVPVPLRAASDAHRKPIGTNSGVRNNRPFLGKLPPLCSPASAQLKRSGPTCSNRCVSRRRPRAQRLGADAPRPPQSSEIRVPEVNLEDASRPPTPLPDTHENR